MFGSVPRIGLFLLLAVSARAATLYVNATGAAPAAPYATWASAAVSIQDAVDAANPGDQIVVTNGIYQTGGRLVLGAITNRVAVTKPVLVESVNGPAATVIVGFQLPDANNGPAAVRCVYLTNGAALIGFTLTNGATLSSGNSSLAYAEQQGGGVWCASTSATLSNCVIVANSAVAGGGASLGTLMNCTLAGNSASSDGGGAISSVLDDCIVTNDSSDYGGGMFDCTSTNCLIVGNWALFSGGGAYGSALYNCTVVGNSSDYYAGGVYAGTATNCIIYYNAAETGSNWLLGVLDSCCTTPQPGNGVNNFTNAPLFVNLPAGNLHLQSNSPCINAGSFVCRPPSQDLDGSPCDGDGAPPDLGAYQVQAPASVISYAWLEQYGLPMDGSADFVDTDGDGMNNWQEWIAGTNPTNALSLLQMGTPSNTVSGIVVQWESVNTRNYFLDCSTNLAATPEYYNVASNIVGLAGITTYTDTNEAGAGPFFYRVGVQQ